MGKPIHIYTDGSVVGNNSFLQGNGWAFIVPDRGLEKYGKTFNQEDTTAKMELQAIVEALTYIAKAPVGDYVIYCDSETTVTCFKGLGSRKLYKSLWNQVHVLIKQILTTDSTVCVEYLNRRALDKTSDAFKYAQRVDRLAYVQANSLEIKK